MQSVGLAVIGMLAFWFGALHERRAVSGEKKRLAQAWERFTEETAAAVKQSQERELHQLAVQTALNQWQERLDKQPDLMRICYHPSMN